MYFREPMFLRGERRSSGVEGWGFGGGAGRSEGPGYLNEDLGLLPCYPSS